MARKVKSPIAKIQSSNSFPGGKLNYFLNNFPDKITAYRKSKIFYIILIALGIGLLFFYKKSWFVAAVVNGSTITNWELQTRLNEQFRSQVLTQLINEKIILAEAAKNNAVPSENEIKQKILEVENQLGGAQALDSFLSQKGQDRKSLKDQIRVQLSVEKLYAKEATVSSEEVTEFLVQYKDQLIATDSASQEKEATEALKNQKLTQVFSVKFQELRSKAKIQIF